LLRKHVDGERRRRDARADSACDDECNGAPGATQAVALEPLVDTDPCDYADAFEIELLAESAWSPDELFRAALSNASWVQRWVPIAHRLVLRLRLVTYVFYVRRTPARLIWAITAPLHRKVAPYLMEVGASSTR
jgi:hypothetical protein